MSSEQQCDFSGWAVVELMGHRKLAGLIREAVIGGAAFIRLDVFGPGDEQPFVTQFYAPGSVYCITPTSEQLAREFASRAKPAPVARYELPCREEGGDE